MMARVIPLLAGAALLFAAPLLAPPYVMHLLIQILLWGFIYTAWSIMGRFGFVSLGHGAFVGVGAYVPALLWNYYDVTPWAGIPLIAMSADRSAKARAIAADAYVGKPLDFEMIELICHPPRIAPPMPVCSKGFPSPKGSS